MVCCPLRKAAGRPSSGAGVLRKASPNLRGRLLRIFARVGSMRFHIHLRWRNLLPKRGFSRDRNTEKTHDEDESTKRRRSSFRGHRQPCVRSGRWRIRPWKPKGSGTAAMAVSLPGLLSRPRFWAALPGAALRLEHRKGPIERRRHRAIAPAFGKLRAVRRSSTFGFRWHAAIEPWTSLV